MPSGSRGELSCYAAHNTARIFFVCLPALCQSLDYLHCIISLHLPHPYLLPTTSAAAAVASQSFRGTVAHWGPLADGNDDDDVYGGRSRSARGTATRSRSAGRSTGGSWLQQWG